MNEIIIKTADTWSDVSDWITVPKIAHANNQQFVCQLDLNERIRASRRFNPFFKFGDAELLVAYRNGHPVGRLSVQVNRLHREIHDAHSGHFGFFDCIDDEAVSSALFDAARTWLKRRQATSISGPYSFSINEESGLLIDGFDTPAAMLMNQSQPYYAKLIEAAGLVKTMDTYAYRMYQWPKLPMLDRIVEKTQQSDKIRLRTIRLDHFEDEVRILIDIFNDAWSGNWDFVPFTEGEIQSMVRELKPFYVAEYGRFVEIEGTPVAFLMAIPDINGIIQPFKGRLLPFNWLRLISTLRGRSFKSARIPLMGIRKQYHRSLMATGILAMLVQAFLREAKNFALDWSEFSWVLETNKPMRNLAELIAGPPVKRYRYYKGSFDAA
jgi:hypothetical protein